MPGRHASTGRTPAHGRHAAPGQQAGRAAAVAAAQALDSLGPETLAGLAPRPVPPPLDSQPHPRLLLQMTRAFLVICAVACAGGALLMGSLLWLRGAGLGGGAGQSLGVGVCVAVYALVAAASALSLRLPEALLPRALTAALCGAALTMCGTAIAMRWGLASPALALMGLMVCVLCAAAGWRHGVLLAAVCMLSVLSLPLLVPLLAGSPAVLPPASLQLGVHLLSIATGLAVGTMVSLVIARYMRSAQEREQRFRRLLALATDAYWEVDQHYRLVAAAAHGSDMRPLSLASGLGAAPWELPRFGCDPETLDQLLADLDTRVPFHDVPMRWSTIEDDGHLNTRDYLVSGEPRFDERGIFTGYWGVARDVTAVHAAHDALMATETRYQDLFSRIPTPLVLHRGGRVIDANPAAVALFGHADLQAMLGADLLAAFESGDSRERERRRMELLVNQPLGTALPVTDFRLLVLGRPVSVRATGVRVEAEGGPAMLAIFVDDTERLAAEDAVRRSEALLSHLVATSPDLITLTDMATGRFAMVNQSFERTTGWTADEVVGRTAQDIGLWADEAELQRFQALLLDGMDSPTANAGGTGPRPNGVADMATRFVGKDGHAAQVIVSAARFVMDRRAYTVVNARDVTQKERERQEREAILTNASIGIAVTRDQTFVLANRHLEQMYGWAPGALIGQPGRVVWGSDAEYDEVSRLAGPVLGRGDAVELERRGQRQDGSSFLARIRGSPIDPTRPAASGTVWIIEDVTERRQFEQALARARDDAEAANRAKSHFLANTSHELRTPLNGMIGLAALAQADDIDEALRRQYLDQITDSAQSLAGIISDILDLSKIEAGKLQLETAVFDLGAELRTVQRSFAPQAAARQLALRFDIAPEIEGNVTGDALRVRQVAGNFIVNAIKFTPSGWVTVRVRRVGGKPFGLVRIEVQDSGPGIDAATRERLFKPFTQADESTTRRFGGTGLGLSICHELATLMGGSVGVHSNLGDGSTFWAELSLPPAAPPPPLPQPASAAALQGKRVLMVEDNAVNMLIAVAMLERWGITVVQAFDGREAVAKVQAAVAHGQPFDAVLMDVQMPVMSGHEATRQLRLLDVGRHLPIIALTAAALVTERDAALQAGMNDFLTKPIDADKLRGALLRWCAGVPTPDPTTDDGDTPWK